MEIAIKILLICWFITRFKPLKMLYENYYRPTIIYNILGLFIFCMPCLTFWTTLICTFNPFLAAGLSFIATWYERLLGQQEEITKLN